MVRVYFGYFVIAVLCFVFLLTSLVGSRLTLKVSPSIGKNMSKGGLLWDIYIQFSTIYVTLLGFICILYEPTPRRIT